MSWLALLLVGWAVTDLAFSVRPMRVVPECLGAGVAVLLALLGGLTEPRDLVALLVVVAAVLAWGQSVTRGFAAGGRASLPLIVLGGSLVVALAAAGASGHAGGPLQDWLDASPVALLHGLDADRFLLLLGAFGVQMSTGNVVVRLVLAATGTMSPARHAMPGDPETRLKGGRLLGPMERIFILGLGLAGHVTAASIVIAAKGLLRFPELQSSREQAQVHQLTEYFLVGSFISWMVALGSLVLLA